MREMIVKVQKPLASNSPDPAYYLYNEARDFTTFIKTSSALDWFFEKGIVKVFLEVKVDDSVDPPLLEIIGLADYQDW